MVAFFHWTSTICWKSNQATDWSSWHSEGNGHRCSTTLHLQLGCSARCSADDDRHCEGTTGFEIPLGSVGKSIPTQQNWKTLPAQFLCPVCLQSVDSLSTTALRSCFTEEKVTRLIRIASCAKGLDGFNFAEAAEHFYSIKVLIQWRCRVPSAPSGSLIIRIYFSSCLCFLKSSLCSAMLRISFSQVPESAGGLSQKPPQKILSLAFLALCLKFFSSNALRLKQLG